MSESLINLNLLVSPAPHIHSGKSYTGAAYTFIIALLPAAGFAIYRFGFDAARVMSLAMASCMAAEAVIQKLFHKPITIEDGSALLTGLIFALIIPPSVPWWLVVTACVLAMLVGKHIYGGKGYHPFNPVLVAWAAVRISWNDFLNFNYAMIKYDLPFPIDYPLTLLKKGGSAAVANFHLMDLFMGKQIGGMGAVFIFLILGGGIFLILRGVISWRIPFFFLAGTLIMAGIFWYINPKSCVTPLFHIVTGNIMIGAFFLATDYSSSPVNKTAMALYGLCGGIITVIFRVWSIYPDGVVFALLLMNIANPLLDRIKPKVPGKEIVV